MATAVTMSPAVTMVMTMAMFIDCQSWSPRGGPQVARMALRGAHIDPHTGPYVVSRRVNIPHFTLK